VGRRKSLTRMKNDLTMVGERTHLLRIERISSLGAETM